MLKSMFQKEKNCLTLEVILSSSNLPYIKKAKDTFVILDNKYSNLGKSFDVLYIVVTKDGCCFKDARTRDITFIEKNTPIEKVLKQVMNICGVLNYGLLKTTKQN